MENQLVVFDLGDEHYGVNIAAVESIIKLQAITAMPHAPVFVKGVTNLRGVVLPVIDLRKRFGLPAKESTRDSRIVVVEVDGAQVGMVVDAVSEVLSVSEGDIEAPPSIVTTVDSAFITGIAKVDGRLIILLDLGQVLDTEEKTDLQTFQQASQSISVGQDETLRQASQSIPVGQDETLRQARDETLEQAQEVERVLA